MQYLFTNYSKKIIHGEYFPHIDGIRALAVLPVVLFHILASICPGGFTGVDVFFVISGYLITGGILRDLNRDQFTIRNFYHRRIRRIFPAYFAMIACVFAVGCAIYYAQPLMFLGNAVAAGTLFVANIHFWRLGGDYFAENLHAQPLLHLWSLSVEEQFYLFIPLMCAVLWRYCRRLILPVLLAIASLSLCGSIGAVWAGKQNSAFYFLHFRAWELLAGSLIAALPILRPSQNDSRLKLAHTERSASLADVSVQGGEESGTYGGAIANQSVAAPIIGHNKFPVFLALLGLLLVIVPFVAISSSTPFPGLNAVPSVFGTALLIRYGQSGWVFHLLSSRPLVAVGKVSYSLYLWHWPVTVFWKYAVYDQLCYYDYLGMFLLSILLGFISWRIVEMPVRVSAFWTQRRTFAFSGLGIVTLVLLGTMCVWCRGWPTVLHVQANKVAYMAQPGAPLVEGVVRSAARRIGSFLGREYKWIADYDLDSKRQFSVFYAYGENGSAHVGAVGDPEIFFLGDSHAGSLRYGLGEVLRKNNVSGYLISCSATDMFNLNTREAGVALHKLGEFTSVDTVVLVQSWSRSLALTSPASEANWMRLEEFSSRIKAMGKKLLLATDIPSFNYAFQEIEAKKAIIYPRSESVVRNSRVQSQQEYDGEQGDVNRKLEVMCNKTGVALIPLHRAFWHENCYRAFVERGADKLPLYRDTHHLSLQGSILAAEFIMPYIATVPRAKAD